ncbi:MAG: hypothetical protein WDO06_05760 [Actinomycetota bacterium]
MAGVSFRAAESANKRKTIFLLVGMGLLVWIVIVAALNYFGESTAAIVPIAVGISLFSIWGAYFSADKLVMTMTGAKIIQESDNPQLFNLIHEVTIASGLPMPKVAIVVDDAAECFCNGKKSSTLSYCIHDRNSSCHGS